MKTPIVIAFIISFCLQGGAILALQGHIIKQGVQIQQLEVALGIYKGEGK